MSLQSLIAAATSLENEYYDEGIELWQNSPFAWIREYKPATVGAIGRRLAKHVVQQAEKAVFSTGRNLRVGPNTIAVKFSMEWTAGLLVFEQIKNADYNYLMCLGVTPDSAYGWLIPKEELVDNGIWQTRDGFGGQHTGVAAQDTAWLHVNPAAVPGWLAPYGGTIPQCEAVIRRTL